MSVNDVDTELYLNGAWTSVPTMADPVTITRGHDPYGGWPRPTRIDCTLDNDDLNYDPTRPESALYGIAGRNTRMRIAPAGNVRVWTEASEWIPERTIEHEPGAKRGKSVTGLVGEGLLRRIGRWTDPLRSPMYRTISSRSSNIGHWALEDESAALTLHNSAGTPGTVSGSYSLADAESPLGAASSLKLTDTTTVSGNFATSSTTAGWQVAFSYRLASVPTSTTYLPLFGWRTSNNYYWLIEVNQDSYRYSVTNNGGDGVSLLSATVGFGTGKEPNQWITFRVKGSVSGGTVTMEPAWYAQGDTNEVGTGATFAGTVGALRSWDFYGNAYTNDGWLSHVFGVTGTADSLVGASAQKVFNGYIGETACARFLRLCLELGVTRFRIGDTDQSTPMGPQRPDTFLNLLAEIRETEDGRIDDERYDIALTMRTRRSLYNQTPAVALTYPLHISPPFRAVLDDAATRNRVTVANRLGGELTLTEAAGPMSVLPPPAGVGEYKHTVDVNVADPEDQLGDIASHHLAKGTLERPRYDSVTVDLIANPALVSSCVSAREGDLLTVDGAEPEQVRLLIVGIREVVSPGTWTITFQTEMADWTDLGVWDDASFRWDSRTSTTAEALDATETGVDITVAEADDVWSTTGVPYDWMIGGERMTVTSVTAPAGVGPYTQTATVTRSVNGVSKTHASGAAVHLADAKRWGY